MPAHPSTVALVCTVEGVYGKSGKSMLGGWNEGCIAVNNNKKMDVIYSFFDIGDMVIILNGNHMFFDMMNPFGNPLVIDHASGSVLKREKYVSELGLVTVFIQALLRLKERNITAGLLRSCFL